MFHYDHKTGFIIQDGGTCCFVYAVCNANIANGKAVTRSAVEMLCTTGKCRTGSVIGADAVVKAANAPLRATANAEEVFERGGILNIMHPIFNGHSFYLDRDQVINPLRLVNSWLGPSVITGVTPYELHPFVKGNLGDHWVLV